MPRRRSTKTGRFEEVFPDRMIVEALREMGVASTREIAEAISSSYNLAFRKLKRLMAEGRVRGKLVGNSYAWWVEAEIGEGI